MHSLSVLIKDSVKKICFRILVSFLQYKKRIPHTSYLCRIKYYVKGLEQINSTTQCLQAVL